MNKMESTYSKCMFSLLNKPFRDWEAYDQGIIDEQGNQIGEPKSVRDIAAYTKFHESVNSLKQSIDTYGNTRLMVDLHEVKSKWNTLTDQYGTPDTTIEKLCEAMVAGDSGGSVSNIASGVTTGSVTGKGPSGKKIVKKKMKSPLED
ncbi:hypothetical protein [Aeromonas phage 65.2]|uniref:Uncharacterized protein n=1 Tax=Aeromonas phage 65.2 TaxID=1932896 RepID=A0A219YBL4_9CAUD|nr:hypothetical protein [Aeromonas phage 65.2]